MCSHQPLVALTVAEESFKWAAVAVSLHSPDSLCKEHMVSPVMPLAAAWWGSAGSWMSLKYLVPAVVKYESESGYSEALEILSGMRVWQSV